MEYYPNRNATIRKHLTEFAQHGHWIDYKTGRHYDPRILAGRGYRCVVLTQEVEAFCRELAKALPEGDAFADKVHVYHMINSMVNDNKQFNPSDPIAPFGYLRLVYLLFALVERWDLINAVIACDQVHLKFIISIPGLDRLFLKHCLYWTNVIANCGTSNTILALVKQKDISFLKDDLEYEWNTRVKKRLTEAVMIMNGISTAINNKCDAQRQSRNPSPAVSASATSKRPVTFSIKRPTVTTTQRGSSQKPSSSKPASRRLHSSSHLRRTSQTSTRRTLNQPLSRSASAAQQSAGDITSRPVPRRIVLPRHLRKKIPQGPPKFPPTLILPPFKDLLKVPPNIQEQFIVILRRHFSSAASSFDFESWERDITSENKFPPRKFLIACHQYEIFSSKRIQLLHKMLDSFNSFEMILDKEVQTKFQVVKMNNLLFVIAVMDNWRILELHYCSKDEAQGLADKFFNCFKQIRFYTINDDENIKSLLKQVEEKWKLQKMSSGFRAWTHGLFPSLYGDCYQGRFYHDYGSEKRSSQPFVSSTGPEHRNGVGSTSSSATPTPLKRKNFFVTVQDGSNKKNSKQVDDIVVISSSEGESDDNDEIVTIPAVVEPLNKSTVAVEAEKLTDSNDKDKERNASSFNNVIIENNEEGEEEQANPRIFISTSLFSDSPCGSQVEVSNPINLGFPLTINSSLSTPHSAHANANTNHDSQMKAFLNRIYKYARDRSVPPEDPATMKGENLILLEGLIVGTSSKVDTDSVRHIDVLTALFNWLLKESVKDEPEVQLKGLFASTYLAIRWGILTNRKKKDDKATLMRQLWDYFTSVLKMNKPSVPDIAFHVKLSRLFKTWTDSYLISFNAVIKQLQATCGMIELAETSKSEQKTIELYKTIYDLIIDLGDVFVESVESNLSHCDIIFCRQLIDKSNEGEAEMKKACTWASLGIIATLKDKRHSAKIAELIGGLLFSSLKISVLADPRNSDKVALQLLFSWKTALRKILSNDEMELLFQRIEDKSLRNKFKALQLPTGKSFQDFYLREAS